MHSNNNVFSSQKKALISILLLVFFSFLFIVIYNYSLNKKFKSDVFDTKNKKRPSHTYVSLKNNRIETDAKPTFIPEPPKILLPIIKENREKYNNTDIYSILKIPDTVIDYPVLKSDNNDYYLNKDSSRNYSFAGSLFFDYENSFEQKDRHYIIYGHNMNSDIMFHSLRYYKQEDYYKKHKYIILEGPYETQTYEVFAFYKTSTDFYYLKVFFTGDDEFLELFNEMKSKSIYDTGVVVDKDDTILTLSTCSNQEITTRYVLNAKLIKSVPYTVSQE